MKKIKAISIFFLLSLIVLISFAKACEANDKLSVPFEEKDKENLISIGSIDNINIMMDESSLEGLSEEEKQKLLSIAIEALINENDIEPSYTTRVVRKVIRNHSCSPSGPYLMDVLYTTFYYYYEDSGLLKSKIEIFLCGHMGARCDYEYHVTTYYTYE